MSYRIGVLVSGRGSNLQAILDAVAGGELPVEVALVISNRPQAYALQRAASRGVPVVVLARRQFASRREQQMAMVAALQEAGVDLVVLAGFDQILHPNFVRAFSQRIINIHPSLLPAFGGGLHAQADALAYGVKVSGCTVHLVTDEVDGGPIILQAAVPVLDDDSPETLAARILVQEHRLLPRAIGLFARGRLRSEGRRVLGSAPDPIGEPGDSSRLHSRR